MKHRVSKNSNVLLAVAALALAVTGAAHAVDFPEKGKPITIVVPFAAGGPTDRVARDLAEALRKPLGGASVVVDNAAGAGSTIGTAKVAKRAKPTATRCCSTTSAWPPCPTLVRNLPFKVETDFEYLGMINDVPMTLIGKPHPAREQLQGTGDLDRPEQGQDQPGQRRRRLGLAPVRPAVPERDEDRHDAPCRTRAPRPAMTDLIGGQIDLMCDQTTNTTSQIEAKKVKAYAVTTPKRLTTPALKDLPTLQESGLKDFQVTIWHGLYAPKGTPAAVLKKLNDALKVALKDPEFIKKQEGLGAVVVTDKRVEPAEHKKFVAAEIAKWSPIIKAAGVYAD